MTDKPEKKPSETILEVPYWSLFRYSTFSEKITLGISIILIICNSAATPSLNLIWGNSTSSFNSVNEGDQILDETKENARNFALIGVGSLLLTGISLSLAKVVGQRQGQRIRSLYFRAILRQEIGWFDTQNPAALSARIEDDCKTIVEGMEDKLILCINSICIFFGCIAVGFIRGWQLALIVTGLIPLMVVATIIFGIVTSKINSVKLTAYTKAGGIAEQALTAIKTVISLSGEKKEMNHYREALDGTEKVLTKFGLIQGLSFGMINFTYYLVMGVGFLVGSSFVKNGTYNSGSGRNYDAGDTVTVFFSIVFGVLSIGIVGPSIKAFESSKQTAHKVFGIIERASLINHEIETGQKPSSIKGEITFEKVNFSYPANPTKPILQNLSLVIESNKKTALVGESGCGKSTCVQLIERLYDPQSGSVLLDGMDLKQYNLNWLRKNIAYVGQEPVLFSMTIRENLMLARPDINEEEIIDALKKANAYDFVMSLEKKLDTFVGTSATQISGGQKQRIAIARAILRNAKILLLDEATSALDARNEREIQETLDKISEGRTTIIIAHRLSTVKNADKIFILDKGCVEEFGTHEELVNFKGKYFELHGNQIVGHNIEYDDYEIPKEREPCVPMLKTEPEVIESSRPLKTEGNVDEDKNLIENNVEKIDLHVKEEPKPVPAETQQPKKKEKDNTVSRIFEEAKPERKWLIASIFFAMMNGLISPANSVVMSKVLAIMLDLSNPDFEYDSRVWSVQFFVLGVLALLCYGFELWLFALTAEKFVKRFRSKIFYKMLKMPMTWHDNPDNAPANLSLTLSSDANNVGVYVGNAAGMIFQAIASFSGALAISFWASWQLSLLSIAIFPFMGMAGAAQVSVMADKKDDPRKKYLQICSESINNIRTVATLGREEHFCKYYESFLPWIRTQNVKTGSFQGFMIGFSNSTIFFFFALVFLVGSVLAVEQGLAVDKMFMGMFVLTFAAMDFGMASQMMPDAGKGTVSAKKLFSYLDMKSSIDVDDELCNVRSVIKGDIEFKNVSFKYPSRSEQIFKNLSFKIPSGKKIAFVGSSGCGKSTILQLLLRLYDVDEGEILVDGVNIKKYDLRHLRQQFSIVSQEPTLFNGTIDYNIKYSKEEASTEDIRKAAEQANALGFIEKNEFDDNGIGANDYGTGFNRKVGPKGGQLSGGQKQRIAIARAIIRNPNVLLLDEATSALDSQNELIVQQSLDKIIEGKSSLTVAHRFSTIKNSDEILVFKDGNIVERGNYEELTKAKSYFYNIERGLI